MTALWTDRPRVKSVKEPSRVDGPDEHRRRVRMLRLLAGVVVIAACTVLGWLVVRSQQASAEVWVARARLDAGSVIEPGDVMLREVDQGSVLDAVDGSNVVVGRTVRLVVPAGSTFVDGHFFADTDSFATPGNSEISIVFALGRITLSVKEDDLLRIVVVNSDDDVGVEIFDGLPIVGVDSGERTGHVVTVSVPVAEGDRLIEALAGGEAWASVVGRQ